MANKRKRFIRKSFDNQLEEVLTKKLYREEVKNLLLDTLYKIETSYQDYSKVKKNVLPKEVYIDNIINAIKDECNSIKFVAPDNKEMAGRTFVVDKEKKTIKCYPIARKLLYSISKIQKSEDIVKTESELVNRTLTNTLNVGNNINTTEPLRDFNGFSWNVSVLEIENLYYNLIYQDLIILVGNEFLEEWINENKAMIEYMELFKEELEKRWGKKVAKNVVELLEKISVLLEFSIDAQFKEQVKAREIVVKKQLEKMSDKAKYLEDISKKKKMVEKEIKDIDKTVNDKELLKQKYTVINKDLPLEKKIFSTRVFAKKLLDDREEYLKKLKECNDLMNPVKFKDRKEKMQREYKYVMLANVEDLYDELFSDIILLQKEIIRILMMKIDNASEKSELLKVMYEIRYFYLLPVINNQRIKDVSKLKRLINMLNKKFFDKAYELKLINKICKQEEDSIDILKNIFLLQIISLEDAELKIAKNDDGYYVQFYEENIEDEAFKIESNLDKKDFKVRINKKIKVFE